MAKPIHFTVNTDGGSRGNPGPAAYGFVIAHDGEPVLEDKGCLGKATNNVAEYHGVIKALQRCAELKATSVLVQSDSELLVRQLTGVYKVKNEALKPLYHEAKALEGRFEAVKYRHVPREENKEADRLCNEALDGEKRGIRPATRAFSIPELASPLDESAEDNLEAAKAEVERILRKSIHAWSTGTQEEASVRELVEKVVEVIRQAIPSDEGMLQE